jgi:hypothetical protein
MTNVPKPVVRTPLDCSTLYSFRLSHEHPLSGLFGNAGSVCRFKGLSQVSVVDSPRREKHCHDPWCQSGG